MQIIETIINTIRDHFRNERNTKLALQEKRMPVYINTIAFLRKFWGTSDPDKRNFVLNEYIEETRPQYLLFDKETADLIENQIIQAAADVVFLRSQAAEEAKNNYGTPQWEKAVNQLKSAEKRLREVRVDKIFEKAIRI
jgi:hypothetical protein